jgi:signal transduction histidine kinase
MKSLLKAFPYSLRLTLPLLILGLGSAVNFISYQQVYQSNHDRVDKEGIQRADFTAGQTAAFLAYLYRDTNINKNDEGINLILSQIRAENNLEIIVLTDENNKIVITNQPEMHGKNITQTNLSNDSTLISNTRNQRFGQTIMVGERTQNEKIKAFYPVPLARQVNELQSTRIGILVLQYSLKKPLGQALEDAQKKSFVTSSVLLIVGLMVWGLLDRLITQRANLLVAISQRWAQGELSDRLALSGTDEFAKIGHALNRMAGSLEVSTAAIKTSESELRERRETLETTLTQLQSTQSQLVQTEKMSSLGQMVAGIAHEVNNPIGFIHGNITHVNRYAEDLLNLVDLYQRQYPEPVSVIDQAIENMDLAFLRQDFPNVMNSMQMGTERVKDIVLSLRNFSRLDESASKAVNLHEGIESTLLILQHRFKSSSSKIVVTKKYSDLPLVHCYAGQINQVFMNILANALDAIAEHLERYPDYSPEITIRTVQMGPDRVKVAILDNGPGMPETVRKRLFDPFFTTKDVGKGTGLGLSISYQIVVEKHGGRLECRSSVGQGTEFTIELPIQAHQHYDQDT